MSVLHKSRSHSQWSSSETSRNVTCAGAIAMKTLCEERETEAAAWGTCCHQISERCLKDGGGDAVVFLGDTETTGKFSFVVDEEMCSTAQTYVDYCRDGQQKYLQETGDVAQWWIEAALSLSSLNPPLEAGGTGDFVIYYPRWRLLEVVDLKGGRGVVVDVKGNPQGRSYAIGALLTLKDIVVDRVMVTIVQPRVGDGLPKSETFHISELLDWTVDLLASMQKSKNALDEFTALNARRTTSIDPDNGEALHGVAYSSRIAFDEWAAKWLTTGQCTFCSAQAICPKRRQEALSRMPEIAAKWHEDVTLTTPLDLTNLARIGSPEELAHDLDGFDAIKDWMKARAAYAHSEAERGVAIPGYQLANRIGDRAWLNSEPVALIKNLRKHLKLKTDEVYEPRKVKSVPQIEKTIGTKRKAELAKLENVLWCKPVTGTNLVSVAKTTRPAAKSLTERFHTEMET